LRRLHFGTHRDPASIFSIFQNCEIKIKIILIILILLIIISRRTTPHAKQFEGFISIAPDEAPVFKGYKMNDVLAKRCTELNIAIGRLSLLTAHDALILFKPQGII